MDNINTYTFLDEATSREPNITEILNEISQQQDQFLSSGSQSLATFEYLKKSRNIRIPFSPSRDKTIEYLVETLVSRYPDKTRPIVTFDFIVDASTKKLSVQENLEFTLLMPEKDYERICAKRDTESLENFINLLRRYRFFNITKLFKITRNKTDLARIIKYEDGKTIFFFKNFSLDKNKTEAEEDYCFHAQNYNSVRDSINLVHLREIILQYNELLMRRLKNFGIINTTFSDYNDSKLDYIFNIFLSDLSPSITDYERIDIKNIHSLRSCLMKAEQILDPLQTLGRDIVKFISENRICMSSDMTSSIMGLTEEILEKWITPENLHSNHIISYLNDSGQIYFIDGANYLNLISELHKLILSSPEKMHEMSHLEKQTILSNMDILYKATRNILSSIDKTKELKLTSDDIKKLKNIIDEYENHLKKIHHMEESLRNSGQRKRKKSVISIIIDFFKKLFKRNRELTGRITEMGVQVHEAVSRETKQIYKKTFNRGPIQALSDLIELIPENDNTVDRVINELRDNNLKIVIPVYNARDLLYPKRSMKVLMPDIEYLLVTPEVARTPETIRKFTDSLVGTKIKDEDIPGKAIMVVEKYLLTHYRQKRAQMLKKEL